MNVQYRVSLTQSERQEPLSLLNGGKHAARKLKRAQILLAADEGVSDRDIAARLPVALSTVGRTKRHFVEGNLERALSEEPRKGAARKLTNNETALLAYPLTLSTSKWHRVGINRTTARFKCLYVARW